MKLIIGIPTLNRADLLEENLRDLSQTFSDLDHLIIVDNGNQTIKIPDNLLNKTKIIRNETNKGVSGSWNQILNKIFYEHNANHGIIT